MSPGSAPYIHLLLETNDIQMIDFVNESNTISVKTMHESVKTLKVCPNGRYLLTAGNKGDIAIWSVSRVKWDTYSLKFNFFSIPQILDFILSRVHSSRPKQNIGRDDLIHRLLNESLANLPYLFICVAPIYHRLDKLLMLLPLFFYQLHFDATLPLLYFLSILDGWPMVHSHWDWSKILLLFAERWL